MYDSLVLLSADLLCHIFLYVSATDATTNPPTKPVVTTQKGKRIA